MNIRLLAAFVLLLAVAAAVLALTSIFRSSPTPSLGEETAGRAISTRTGSTAPPLSAEELIMKNLPLISSDVIESTHEAKVRKINLTDQIAALGLEAVPILEQVAGSDRKEQMKTDALALLHRIAKEHGGKERILGIFSRVARSKKQLLSVRAVALGQMCSLGGPESLEEFKKIWDDKEQPEKLRSMAIRQVGRLGGEEAVAFLTGIYNNPESDTALKLRALRGLADTRHPKALREIVSAINELENEHSKVAIRLTAAFGKDAVEPLRDLQKQETDEEIKKLIKRVIFEIKWPEND
jgi:hypothetical protein